MQTANYSIEYLTGLSGGAARRDPRFHRALPVRRRRDARHGADDDHDPARSGRADTVVPAPLQAPPRAAPRAGARADLRGPVLLPVLHQEPSGEAVRVHGRGPARRRTWTCSRSTARGSSWRRRTSPGSTSSGSRSGSTICSRSCSERYGWTVAAVTDRQCEPWRERPGRGVVPAADRGRQRGRHGVLRVRACALRAAALDWGGRHERRPSAAVLLLSICRRPPARR